MFWISSSEVAFDRLGLVCQGIASVLELGYLPSVYVTTSARGKDLTLIGRHLGVDPEFIYLFDDRSPEHIEKIIQNDPIQAPYAAEHMITVDKFNFRTMDSAQSLSLQTQLEESCPLQGKIKGKRIYDEIVNATEAEWPTDHRSIDSDERWIVHKPELNMTTIPWETERVIETANNMIISSPSKRSHTW